jgi:hypothetical protein
METRVDVLYARETELLAELEDLVDQPETERYRFKRQRLDSIQTEIAELRQVEKEQKIMEKELEIKKLEVQIKQIDADVKIRELKTSQRIKKMEISKSSSSGTSG